MEPLFDEVDETAESVDAAVEVAAATEAVADDGAKFGEQLAQLEAIVVQLESGQLDLEDSLKSYGEGVQLIRSLQAKLVDAEQKVQVMMGEIAPGSED